MYYPIMHDKASTNQPQKPTINDNQIKEIQWLKSPKGQGLHVGKWKEYTVLSKYKTKGPILVYNQAEWEAFLDGVNKGEFDDLTENTT
jgi:hypothetical protein